MKDESSFTIPSLEEVSGEDLPAVEAFVEKLIGQLKDFLTYDSYDRETGKLKVERWNAAEHKGKPIFNSRLLVRPNGPSAHTVHGALHEAISSALLYLDLQDHPQFQGKYDDELQHSEEEIQIGRAHV